MKEIRVSAKPGYIILLGILIAIIALILAMPTIISTVPWIVFPIGLIVIFTLFGFIIIYPNQSRVLTFFGKYVGTVRENGF
jgi:uncharacterized membrane protein